VEALAAAPRGAFVLIGFMGAGKSTFAAELARALDSDALLEQQLGHSLAQEFDGSGAGGGGSPAGGLEPGGAEREFRAKEEQLVCQLLEQAQPGAVIALGGGSVLSPRVRNALAQHVVVLLDVGAEEAWQRVSSHNGGAERPLARDREAFFALHAERQLLYESLADAQLPTPGLSAVAPALGALRALAAAPAGARMLWAATARGAYPVLIGHGLLDASAALAQAWQLPSARSRPFCVSDDTVAALYASRLGDLAATIAIPAGEQHKTLVSAEHVWHGLIAAGMTRADHLIALGGGVVGDLAGFCAATYQRGVAVVQVPTTLLAQVDAAYGGKTGVDLREAKNYIGAYHQPAGVLVDPDTLATLPPAELAAGWVEVLKTALIGGGELWQRVSRGEQVDQQIIVACARTKLAVVAADERDAGCRRLLNLGHTVGHAIETATGYARYRHGEAVGLGLLAALRLSGQDQLRALVSDLLAARGLPVTLEHASVDVVEQAIARDKKRTGARVPFVLVRAPGELSIDDDVAAADVRAAVEELAR
jgi:shikimate kinase/3-dehydroquinate synthase